MTNRDLSTEEAHEIYLEIFNPDLFESWFGGKRLISQEQAIEIARGLKIVDSKEEGSIFYDVLCKRERITHRTNPPRYLSFTKLDNKIEVIEYANPLLGTLY